MRSDIFNMVFYLTPRRPLPPYGPCCSRHPQKTLSQDESHTIQTPLYGGIAVPSGDSKGMSGRMVGVGLLFSNGRDVTGLVF